MNSPINPEVEQLLKQKGYTGYYPTITDAILWLYKNHCIWLWVSPKDSGNENGKTMFIACARFVPTKRKGKFEIDPVLHQPKYTPEEAYEFGIKYLLTNVL